MYISTVNLVKDYSLGFGEYRLLTMCLIYHKMNGNSALYLILFVLFNTLLGSLEYNNHAKMGKKIIQILHETDLKSQACVLFILEALIKNRLNKK